MTKIYKFSVSRIKILWQHLRANRLNGLHFRRQQIIDGFIVDFYCHTAGLVIEIDGEIHQQQAEYDVERDKIERDKILTARELRILRIRNSEVRDDLEGVLNCISKACDLTPQPPSLQGKGELGFQEHKAELLAVLDCPQLPLHNNEAESDLREHVTRRKISGGTRSEAGRRLT